MNPANTEQELREIEQAFAQAMLDSNVAFLDNILSDEVVFTNFHGKLTSKAEDLALFESGDLVVTTYTANDMTIRSYGTTAIVNLGLTVAGTFKNEPFSGQYRYTRIYLKQSETWQVIAAQATIITPNPS